MKTAAALILITLALLCDEPVHAVTFDWAMVGNSGNADDIHGAGYGGVDNTYRISKHEVSNKQYTEFLNKVDPTGVNPNRIYSEFMSFDARGGIVFNGGAPNGAKYGVKSGRDNNPVVFVSFFDAMRFVNWLHNGQGSGGTESGAYTIGNGFNEARTAGAQFWIPSEDEWYKAAYHKNDGVTGNYWDFPTSTDSEPYSDQPPGEDAPVPSNTANFVKDDFIPNGYDDGYAVTGAPFISFGQNYLTDVGAYSHTASPYGTFDQGGNVWEWNEAVIGSSFRGFRGGSSEFALDVMRADSRQSSGPTLENVDLGFRVASIPEPNTVLLGFLITTGLLLWRIRLSHPAAL
jgi:formylglycine-generating enzyme